MTRAVWDRTIERAQASGVPDLLDGISGIHFHTLCEQDAEPLERTLLSVDERWGDILSRAEITWLNMGGGHHITKPRYNRGLLEKLISKAKSRWNLDVLLEPGEAVAIHSGILTSRILDIHENNGRIAILDVSATCHMPDTIEMPYTPEVWGGEIVAAKDVLTAALDENTTRLAGRTCLSGDIIGGYRFTTPPQRGEVLVLDDMAHYTTVKTTGFNGIPHPALVVWDSRTGRGETVRQFTYEDFLARLS